MRKIFAFAWKDYLLRFSNRSELFTFIVLPIIFTVLIRYAAGGGGGESGIALLVVNQDTSQQATELINELSKSETLAVKEVTADKAEKQFEDKQAPIWLTIPAGFGDTIMAGQDGQLELHKAANNLNADSAEQAINAAVSTISRSLVVARNSLAEAKRLQPNMTEAEWRTYFAQGLTLAQGFFKDTTTRLNATQPASAGEVEFNMGTQASTGQLVTWVFIPLLSISSLFAYERMGKTLQRLITTPTHKFTYLLGTVVGQLATALVQMILLVLFGVYVMRINWGHSLAGLGVMLLTFGLASAALGTAMGTFIKTEKQAGNLSIMIGMVFALLGGCWYPVELFPQFMRTVAQFLPTYWAMNGFNDLASRGLGLVDILPAAGVLVGFAVVFFAIGLWRFRYE